jgi:hypothetical protein
VHHTRANHEFFDQDSFRTLNELLSKCLRPAGGLRLFVSRKEKRPRSGEDRSRLGHPAFLGDRLDELESALICRYDECGSENLYRSNHCEPDCNLALWRFLMLRPWRQCLSPPPHSRRKHSGSQLRNHIGAHKLNALEGIRR